MQRVGQWPAAYVRDISLTAAFSVLLVLSLRHTWVGCLVWTWFSLMNPHRLAYGFAHTLPFAAITAGATLLSILWSRGKVRLPADASVLVLILFVLWMCVTTAFAFFPEPSSDQLLIVLKIQLMTLVCIAALRERKHIELFVWINVMSIAFYGIKGGLFAIVTGGMSRVWGPADSYIEDNNALGLAMVMIIPLMYYLRQVATRLWLRHGLLLGLVLCAVAVLATQSRGAFLAIAVMSLVLWTRTRRKVLTAAIFVFAASALIAFMPSSWEERMQTIGNYQEDSSALQRVNAWVTAVNVANDRITGAGFAIGNKVVFEAYAPNPDWVFTAHSIYFQVLGEQGYVGLLLFLTLGALGFRNASQIRKQALRNPETMWLHDLGGMVQVSMVGYAVGGAFLSLSYFDLPYNIMVILIASKYWLHEERWKTESVGAFGSTSTAQRATASGGVKAPILSP